MWNKIISYVLLTSTRTSSPSRIGAASSPPSPSWFCGRPFSPTGGGRVLRPPLPSPLFPFLPPKTLKKWCMIYQYVLCSPIERLSKGTWGSFMSNKEEQRRISVRCSRWGEIKMEERRQRNRRRDKISEFRDDRRLQKKISRVTYRTYQ